MLIKLDYNSYIQSSYALHGGCGCSECFKETMKICAKCREEKDFGGFHKNKRQKDGLSALCKSCQAAYYKAYYKVNRVEKIKQTRAYYQANKEKISKQARAYDQRNKTRKAEINKAYRKINNEKILRQKKAYRKANPEKGRIIVQRRRSKKANLPSTLTSKQWQETVEACAYKCVYCGKPWEHQDHFVPVVLGGGYTVNNMVPACERCNKSKGGKSPFEFIRSIRKNK